MSVLKKGSTGPEVKGIQLRLNTRLTPSPKLSIDGYFGPATEASVIRFQRDVRLSPDGVIGPKTSAALAALPKSPPPPNLSKFVAELGTLDDLVQHVRALEAMKDSTAAVMNGVADFFGTAGRKRYLLVGGDKVGVIDFRHFFAAATESYNSNPSISEFGVRMGGSPGQAVLLGVGNEVRQCVGEGIASKFNSCFAAEDLGSNRLGAGFGELLKVKQAERSALTTSQLLREYLAKYQPLPPEKINLVKTADRWDVALETLAAIVAGLGDILIRRVY